MKISLLCPTRNRPHQMERLWKSILETADEPKNLEIIFYMDNDDPHSLAQFNKMDKEDEKENGTSRIQGILGERIVLSQMWNECLKLATGEIIQHLGDDLVFRSKGWDTLVRKHINSYPDKVVFVYGRDGIQDEKLGTHGFLHKNWIKATGGLFKTNFSCDFNDLWLHEVAGMAKRRIYDPNIFTEHMHWGAGKAPQDQTYQETITRGRRDNVQKIYDDSLPERLKDVENIKKFISEYKE